MVGRIDGMGEAGALVRWASSSMGNRKLRRLAHRWECAWCRISAEGKRRLRSPGSS